MPPPTLHTARLTLRAYAPADAPALAHLCNDFDVVRQTASHPFPYELRHAAEFIDQREADFLAGKSVVLGAFRSGDAVLVGGAGLRREPDHQRAELGYMIARDQWGLGYATEIAARVLGYAFEELGLVRVHAGAYADNAPSIRVLEKLGFVREGLQRRHALRLGAWRDLALFGMLREEYVARPPAGAPISPSAPVAAGPAGAPPAGSTRRPPPS